MPFKVIQASAHCHKLWQSILQINIIALLSLAQFKNYGIKKTAESEAGALAHWRAPIEQVRVD